MGLNFEEERNRCVAEKKLFEDPEFPASDESLYMQKAGEQSSETEFQKTHRGYIWKRPGVSF